MGLKWSQIQGLFHKTPRLSLLLWVKLIPDFDHCKAFGTKQLLHNTKLHDIKIKSHETIVFLNRADSIAGHCVHACSSSSAGLPRAWAVHLEICPKAPSGLSCKLVRKSTWGVWAHIHYDLTEHEVCRGDDTGLNFTLDLQLAPDNCCCATRNTRLSPGLSAQWGRVASLTTTAHAAVSSLYPQRPQLILENGPTQSSPLAHWASVCPPVLLYSLMPWTLLSRST